MSASPPEISVDALLKGLQPLIDRDVDRTRAVDWLVGLSALMRIRDEMAPKSELLARIRRDYAHEPAFLRDALFQRVAERPYFLTDPGALDRLLRSDAQGNQQVSTNELAEVTAPALQPVVELLENHATPAPRWLEEAFHRLDITGVTRLPPVEFGRFLGRLGLAPQARGDWLPDPRLVRLVGALASAQVAPGLRTFDPHCLTGDLLAYIAEMVPEARLIGLERDQRLSRIAASRLLLSGYSADVRTPHLGTTEACDAVALALPGPPLNRKTAVRSRDVWDWLHGHTHHLPALVPPWSQALRTFQQNHKATGAIVLPLGRDRRRALHWLLGRQRVKTLILLPVGALQNTGISLELAVVGEPDAKIRVINGRGLRGDWGQRLIELTTARSDPRIRDVNHSVVRDRLSLRSLFTPAAPRLALPQTRKALAAAAGTMRTELQVLEQTDFALPERLGAKTVRPLGELARIWRPSQGTGGRRSITVVGLNKLSWAERSFAPGELLARGDTLIHSAQADRMPEAFVWRGEGPAIAARRLLVVRALDPLLSEWLGVYLQSTTARLAMVKHWAGVHGLSTASIRNLPIPLPAEDQRSALVNALTPALDAARQVHLQLDTLRHTTKEHATALLDEALAGIGED